MIRDGAFSPDEYVTGWIKRGPTGVIGTNKSDAVETVTSLLADIRDGAVRRTAAPGSWTDYLPIAESVHWACRRGTGSMRRRSSWELADGRLRTTLAHRSELLEAAEKEA